MRKLIIANCLIPIISIVILILENVSINGERMLSIKYRMLIFDYGFIFLVLQAIILLISLFVWRTRRQRVVAVSIFLAWIIICLLMPSGPGLFD
jgi:predicted membrane channel-forming protein YqfA (hemolysin III family)